MTWAHAGDCRYRLTYPQLCIKWMCCLVWRSSHFIPEENSTSIHWIRWRVGPSFGLDAMNKKESLTPAGNPTCLTRLSILQSNRYTVYAVPYIRCNSPIWDSKHESTSPWRKGKLIGIKLICRQKGLVFRCLEMLYCGSFRTVAERLSDCVT